MKKKIFNIAFLTSHGGSNMQAIIDAYNNSTISSIPTLVISNNSDSYALKRAKIHNIPSLHISSKNLHGFENQNEALLHYLNKYKIDLIILAGYMKKIHPELISKFQKQNNGIIINIHPALLPKFGGKGMYGMNVHQAVFQQLKNNEINHSGATVHYINQNYDEGEIILQQKIDITQCQSPEEIAEKVLKIEHKIYTQAIKQLEENYSQN